MGTTPLHTLPYPEGTDQPYVHLDIQALADAVDAKLPLAQVAAPAHQNGRIWFDSTTKITWVSDGTVWRPLGEHTMGKVQSGVTGGQTIGATVGDLLSLTCVLVAGPAVMHSTGFVQNGGSGAVRSAGISYQIDGVNMAQGANMVVTNTPANDGVGLAFAFDFDATAGSHTFKTRGVASIGGAVVFLNGRLWVTQGGLG